VAARARRRHHRRIDRRHAVGAVHARADLLGSVPTGSADHPVAALLDRAHRGGAHHVRAVHDHHRDAAAGPRARVRGPPAAPVAPFGWWSIRVNRLSGRSASDAQSQQFADVLPVGTRRRRAGAAPVPARISGADVAELFTRGAAGSSRRATRRATPRARAGWRPPLSWRRNGAARAAGAAAAARSTEALS
jgi:hypothetical protein